MRQPLPAALVAALLVLHAANAAPADNVDQVAAAKGKVIYQRYCASCHGLEGRGDGAIASDLRVPPADLTRLSEKAGGAFSIDALARSIDGRRTVRAHGTPDMPVWGEIFPKTGGTEAASVTSAVYRISQYVWSLQKPK